MSSKTLSQFLSSLMGRDKRVKFRRTAEWQTNDAGVEQPAFSSTDLVPEKVEMTSVQQADGRLSQYPPSEKWDEWVEYEFARLKGYVKDPKLRRLAYFDGEHRTDGAAAIPFLKEVLSGR